LNRPTEEGWEKSSENATPAGWVLVVGDSVVEVLLDGGAVVEEAGDVEVVVAGTTVVVDGSVGAAVVTGVVVDVGAAVVEVVRAVVEVEGEVVDGGTSVQSRVRRVAVDVTTSQSSLVPGDDCAATATLAPMRPTTTSGITTRFIR
jgi:hypothetical protein